MICATGEKKAVICIAAGKSQIIVLRKVKELGYAVIAVDRDPDAPGFKLADRKIIASTHEPVSIISELQQLSDRYVFAGIVNRSAGPPVVTAAHLSARLGLPGVSPEIAGIVIDKGMLMEKCRKAGLPVPAGCVVPFGHNIDPSIIDFPCVVRPSLSMIGKSGVRIVNKSADLADAIAHGREASVNGRVNVEEFVPGCNVSLISFVREGILIPLLLVDELNGHDEINRVKGTGMAVPSRFHGKREEELIVNAAKDVALHLGLGTTVCCMSFRCTPKGSPKLIEIHLDMGGDLILDELLPASTEFDFISYFVRGLVGETVAWPQIEIRPAAVLFGEGEDLVSERPFKILRESCRASLEKKVLTVQENIYA